MVIGTSSDVTETKKRRRLGLFQPLVFVALLVIVGIVFAFNVLVPRMQPGIPERLGALELTSVTEGAAAMAQINKLHGTYIELVDAFIAEYVHSSPYHGTAQVTVWVGSAKSSEATAELTRRMVAGIEKGGSGFSNLQRLTIDGHQVFQIEGTDGKHFFYISEKGEQVVWLTVEASDPLAIVKEALKIF